MHPALQTRKLLSDKLDTKTGAVQSGHHNSLVNKGTCHVAGNPIHETESSGR